ncbi:MAG: DUF1987 domain-containing protein [Bacteroidales bacterium]
MEVLVTKEILKEVNEAKDKNEVFINGTSETPEVELNKNTGEIKFQGRSMPEDAKSFYLPLKEWITEYAKNPAPATHVVFSYEYFNTASSKMIMEIIEEINKISNKDKQMKAEWHYLEDDDDMLEAGEDYEEITGLEFEYISYE